MSHGWWPLPPAPRSSASLTSSDSPGGSTESIGTLDSLPFSSNQPIRTDGTRMASKKQLFCFLVPYWLTEAASATWSTYPQCLRHLSTVLPTALGSPDAFELARRCLLLRAAGYPARPYWCQRGSLQIPDVRTDDYPTIVGHSVQGNAPQAESASELSNINLQMHILAGRFRAAVCLSPYSQCFV